MFNNKPEHDETKENSSSESVSDHSIASLPTMDKKSNISYSIYGDGKEECKSIRELSDAGFDLNAPIQHQHGRAPAHIAAMYGHIERLRVLSDLGADLNALDDIGNTPAHWAARQDQAEVLRVLSDLGADLNALTEHGFTPADIALIEGHAEVLNVLFELGAKLGRNISRQANRYARKAVSNGHSEMLRALCKFGANPDTRSDHLYAERILELFEFGDNPNARNDRYDNNRYDNNKFVYALAHIAALNGHVEVLRVLHEFGADLNAASGIGTTPADIAASKGDANMLNVLLFELGAKLYTQNGQGYEFARIAASNGFAEIINVLYKLDVNIHQRDDLGCTLAYIAASNGHIEVLRVLHKFGANLLNTPNKHGDTPAHIAASNGHIEVLRVLSALGANLNTPNKHGDTPAHIATKKGNIEMLDIIAAKNNAKQMLLSCIQEMKLYGSHLKSKASPKGEIIMNLALELEKMALDFQIETATSNDFIKFKKNFSTVLNSKNKEIGQYDVSWSTIMKNIAIALTGIGLFFIAGKLLYSQLTENRALFFFQNNKTDAEVKLDEVNASLTEMESRMLPPRNV